MEILYTLLAKLTSGIGPFFLLLGLLIFVHELGHYLVAVYFGVRVETFSLGFGKKLFTYKRGETTYCISLIPLGGYVKMYGDDPTAEIPEEQKKYSFLHKPVWPRIAIVLAGPLMNLFFAMFIFALIGFIGEPVSGTKLGDIKPDTAAHIAGFRSGDKIISVNDKVVNQWDEVKAIVESHAGQSLLFTVQREESGQQESLTATPVLGRNPFIFSTQREVGLIQGLEIISASTMIGITNASSPANKYNLKTFDVIEQVNGQDVLYWRNLDKTLRDVLARGENIQLTVSRQSKGQNSAPERITIEIPPSEFQSSLSPLEHLGIERSDLFLRNVRESTPAHTAGLQAGDYVTKVDGRIVDTWQVVLDRVKSFKPEDKAIQFHVLRNGKELDFTIAPALVDLPTDQGAMEKRYAIGVEPAIYSVTNDAYIFRTTNPLKATWYGIEQSWVWTKLIAVSFVRLIQNEVSPKNIGGVITIGRVASKSFEAGITAFLKMMAIISINLFLLNLLPIPVLDGGHLVFFTLEALKGAPISFKKLEIAQQVGLVLLLSLMVFALFNDITHLISSW